VPPPFGKPFNADANFFPFPADAVGLFVYDLLRKTKVAVFSLRGREDVRGSYVSFPIYLFAISPFF